jgi:hypothetical protein
MQMMIRSNMAMTDIVEIWPATIGVLLRYDVPTNADARLADIVAPDKLKDILRDLNEVVRHTHPMDGG